jgi:hypothetical protein
VKHKRAEQGEGEGSGVVLSKEEVIPLLLQAAPGFLPKWQEHLDWWKGEPAGIFNDAGAFAHYLVDSFEQGDTSEFEEVFATLERLIREGWLGLLSWQAWEELDDLWRRAGGSLAGVVRYEAQMRDRQAHKSRWWQFWKRC